MEIEYAPSFKKSWNKLFAWYYAPLRWVKAVMYWPMNIKHAYQRVSRGWSDADTWGMDWHLARVIPQMARHLAKNLTGCPASLYDDGVSEEDRLHKWKEILETMASGFEQKIKWEDEYCEMMGLKYHEGIFKEPEFKTLYDFKDKQINDEFNKSMDLFKEYFWNLWD